ncbi:fatty acid desaturase-domain-containing protein [Globomyces pollinis-pini]|nr:fatty acid desaturase-domain-containing protein [Globomyces pollinis-pini]
MTQKSSLPNKVMTMAEVQLRVAKGDTLIILFDKVYNVSKWLQYHPGGSLALQNMAGKDATDAMIVLHPEWAMEKIHPFYIAHLHENDVKENAISSDFKKLNEKFKELGFYRSDPYFWIQENLKFVAIFSSMIYLAVYCESLWAYYASAVLAATLWHQMSFVAHDTGHCGVTGNRVIDSLYGIFLASWCGGLSIGWWKLSHYVHHIITNDPEHDPDIQHLPFMAVTARLTEGLYSTYHKRIMVFDKIAAFFVARQHYFYYVIMAFGRFNLYAQSLSYALFHDKVFCRPLEIIGMGAFWSWFLWTISHGPTWYHVLGYVFVSHCCTGLLHVQITLSHFGMSTVYPEHAETFAELGLRTSMDVDCPRWLDWLHGGLQFQVSHHLFPRVPRHHLRTITPYIMEFAKKHDIPYHTYTFTKGNTFVLQHLQDIANQVSAILSPDESHISVR